MVDLNIKNLPYFINHTKSPHLSKKDQKKALAASIVIGIFFGGTAHLVCLCLKNRIKVEDEEDERPLNLFHGSRTDRSRTSDELRTKSSSGSNKKTQHEDPEFNPIIDKNKKSSESNRSSSSSGESEESEQKPEQEFTGEDPSCASKDPEKKSASEAFPEREAPAEASDSAHRADDSAPSDASEEKSALAEDALKEEEKSPDVEALKQREEAPADNAQGADDSAQSNASEEKSALAEDTFKDAESTQKESEASSSKIEEKGSRHSRRSKDETKPYPLFFRSRSYDYKNGSSHFTDDCVLYVSDSEKVMRQHPSSDLLQHYAVNLNRSIASSKMHSLVAAIREGNIEQVEALAASTSEEELNQRVRISSQEEFTPLEWAVLEGNLEMVQLLVEKGCKSSIRTVNAWEVENPQYYAPKPTKTSALYLALTHDHLEIAEYLLDQGANPFEPLLSGDYDRPLPSLIAREGSLEEMELLFSYAEGAKLFGPALREAYHSDQAEIMEFLLDQGVKLSDAFFEVDCSVETLFLDAVQSSSYHIVKLFIEKGISVNTVHPQCGLSALHYAAMKNDQKMIDYLEEQGIDEGLTTTRDISFGYSLNGEKIVIPGGADYETVAKVVLNKKALNDLYELCTKTTPNYTPCFEDLEECLYFVADLNAVVKDGATLLHLAADQIYRPEMQQLVKLLMIKGANPTKDTNGDTPYDIVIRVSEDLRKRIAEEFKGEMSSEQSNELKTLFDGINEIMELFRDPYLEKLTAVKREGISIPIELAQNIMKYVEHNPKKE